MPIDVIKRYLVFPNCVVGQKIVAHTTPPNFLDVGVFLANPKEFNLGLKELNDHIHVQYNFKIPLLIYHLIAN